MEYCDKGSLRHALKRGVFHKRLGNTSVAVDLCAIVQVGGGLGAFGGGCGPLRDSAGGGAGLGVCVGVGLGGWSGWTSAR